MSTKSKRSGVARRATPVRQVVTRNDAASMSAAIQKIKRMQRRKPGPVELVVDSSDLGAEPSDKAAVKAETEEALKNLVSPNTLMTGLLTGAMIGLGRHATEKLLGGISIKAKVVDLVIEFGLADVEAALARIKARIEAVS